MKNCFELRTNSCVISNYIPHPAVRNNFNEWFASYYQYIRHMYKNIVVPSVEKHMGKRILDDTSFNNFAILIYKSSSGYISENI